MPRVLSANTLLVDLEVAASVAEMFEGHKLLAARLREHARRLETEMQLGVRNANFGSPERIGALLERINGGPAR